MKTSFFKSMQQDDNTIEIYVRNEECNSGFDDYKESNKN